MACEAECAGRHRAEAAGGGTHKKTRFTSRSKSNTRPQTKPTDVASHRRQYNDHNILAQRRRRILHAAQAKQGAESAVAPGDAPKPATALSLATLEAPSHAPHCSISRQAFRDFARSVLSATQQAKTSSPSGTWGWRPAFKKRQQERRRYSTTQWQTLEDRVGDERASSSGGLAWPRARRSPDDKRDGGRRERRPPAPVAAPGRACALLQRWRVRFRGRGTGLKGQCHKNFIELRL